MVEDTLYKFVSRWLAWRVALPVRRRVVRVVQAVVQRRRALAGLDGLGRQPRRQVALRRAPRRARRARRAFARCTQNILNNVHATLVPLITIFESHRYG